MNDKLIANLMLLFLIVALLGEYSNKDQEIKEEIVCEQKEEFNHETQSSQGFVPINKEQAIYSF